MEGGNSLTERRALSFLTAVMAFVIVGLLAFVLLAAFWDLEILSERVESLLRESLEYLQIAQVTDEARRTMGGYLERLKAASTEAMQAHTIAFLFQVFSVALISLGAYLVVRCKKDVEVSEVNVRKVKESVSLLAEFIGNASVSVTLVCHALMAVERACYLLVTGKRSAFTTQAVLARDLIRNFRMRMIDAVDCQRGIDEAQHTILLDQIRNILQALRKTPKQLQKNVEDILAMCEECERLLRNRLYVERYREVLKRIVC
jgi:hypothetical protein